MLLLLLLLPLLLLLLQEYQGRLSYLMSALEAGLEQDSEMVRICSYPICHCAISLCHAAI
jgi:hypothetical protein